MPDETATTPTASAEPSTPVEPPSQLEQSMMAPSELENLVAEAEAAAITNISGLPKFCNHVDTATLRDTDKKCVKCAWCFCVQCASVLDPSYCKRCLPTSEGNFPTESLKDADGVIHEGRVMHPDPNGRFFQPRFGTLAQTIAEMDDSHLEDYIKYYRDLVKQAETALDFRRVVLGSSQLELAQRQDATRRKLRSDKTKYPVKTLTVNKDGTGKKKTAAVGDLIKMLEMLKQLQKNRDAKAQGDKS